MIEKEFLRDDHGQGFSYYFEDTVKAGETVFLLLPRTTANKRGVNDIGWQIDGEAKLYGTASVHPDKDTALWQEIHDYEDINLCASAVKIVGEGGESKVCIKIRLN